MFSIHSVRWCCARTVAVKLWEIYKTNFIQIYRVAFTSILPTSAEMEGESVSPGAGWVTSIPMNNVGLWGFTKFDQLLKMNNLNYFKIDGINYSVGFAWIRQLTPPHFALIFKKIFRASAEPMGPRSTSPANLLYALCVITWDRTPKRSSNIPLNASK